MYSKLNTPLKSTAIVGLVLFVALSVAGAKTYHQRSGSVGWLGAIIPINIEENRSATVTILPTALTDYLDEHGRDAVDIAVKMKEKGEVLEFTFGPSGCYFDPPLMLTLTGGYVNGDQMLYGEDGEALEYQSYFDGEAMVFEIPHFSEYSYDDYY